MSVPVDWRPSQSASFHKGPSQLNWPQDEVPIGNYSHVFGHTESTIEALLNAFAMSPGVSDNFNEAVKPYLDPHSQSLSCVKAWVGDCLCSLVEDPIVQEALTGAEPA
jgi:hypothetical protein